MGKFSSLLQFTTVIIIHHQGELGSWDSAFQNIKALER